MNSSTSLTANERRALTFLPVGPNAISHKDLKARHQVTLDAKSRERLRRAGLIKVRSVGPSKKEVHWLELTPQGAQVVTEMSAAPPLASVSEGPRYGDVPYSVGERAVLLTLMAVAQPLSGAELKENHGLSLSAASRKRLERDQLLTVRAVKVAGSRKSDVRLELSDAGWVWAAQELAGPPPEKAGPGGAALYALMGALNRFLDRNQLVLADVFGEEPLVRHTAAPARNSASLEAQIREAYRAVCPFPGAWVSLADVRDRLAGAPREAVDAVLIRLFDARVANLMPNENLKTITARDRASAIRLGDRDRHILVLE
jgi:hypothetical protein